MGKRLPNIGATRANGVEHCSMGLVGPSCFGEAVDLKKPPDDAGGAKFPRRQDSPAVRAAALRNGMRFAFFLCTQEGVP